MILGVVLIVVYLATLLQIGLLGAWPLFGGTPNLLVLGSLFFLLSGNERHGLAWVAAGGVLLDLLLPSPFGLVVLPLVLSYGMAALALRRWLVQPTWFIAMLLGLVMLLVTELPLTIYAEGWLQLVRDLGAGFLLLVPVTWWLTWRALPTQHGLKLETRLDRR